MTRISSDFLSKNDGRGTELAPCAISGDFRDFCSKANPATSTYVYTAAVCSLQNKVVLDKCDEMSRSITLTLAARICPGVVWCPERKQSSFSCTLVAVQRARACHRSSSLGLLFDGMNEYIVVFLHCMCVLYVPGRIYEQKK